MGAEATPFRFAVGQQARSPGHHHAGLWVLIPIFFLARILFWGRRPWHTRYQSPHA